MDHFIHSLRAKNTLGWGGGKELKNAGGALFRPSVYVYTVLPPFKENLNGEEDFSG